MARGEFNGNPVVTIVEDGFDIWRYADNLEKIDFYHPRRCPYCKQKPTAEGHEGIIYQATNAYRIGQSTPATFYLDENNRLRHPRQNGINITKEMALEKGWMVEKRLSKNRYLWLLPDCKSHKKWLINNCKYNLKNQKFD